ncbi:Crp/Fnr family transcriptional regulator [Lacrimispora sp. 210928-DFI.3.58]|uniref:Crp/Fnr family transcriptional regulator n=1 Tax=Lacrimispora sp. 210928-DFI.3.58 TaxID=2883214 RepID=UPI001D05C95E|nr:Crp/Fnr family transcriptional regulator [Lacrimispora sp. 210928-DFI.3.58]MCB7320199.1 Crp/Fnr family transcriptional regulator [Lacrimispora sp. 210928-DFI.3.58]
MQLDKSSFTRPGVKNAALEELIRENSTSVTYPAKRVFLEPGMEPPGVYYIVDGRTRHYMIGADGTEKILYTLSAGWFYGETPCSLGEPTGLFSKAEVKTQINIIPHNTYEKLLDTNKMFRDAILESYSNKMLILRHEIENLTFNSCKNRLKRLFCSTADTDRLIEDKWYGLKVQYTQYELSTIVGGARVTISKLINELCDESFIRILNRSTQVSAEKYKEFVEKRY